MRFRTNATNLRLLLLGALGGAVWACAGETEDCVAGDPACAEDLGHAGAGGGASDGVGPTGGDGGTGGTATGGVGDGGGTTGGTGGALPSPKGCLNPVPRVEGVDTGTYTCAGYHVHREVAVACPSNLPRPYPVEWPELQTGTSPDTTSADECSTDADCPELSACTVVHTNPVMCGPPLGPKDYARLCVPGCIEDSDCAPSELCLCGDDIGSCKAISESAGCHDDSDCGAGLMCLSNAVYPNEDIFEDGPTRSTFACQLLTDECDTYQDCATPLDACYMTATGRKCVEDGVQCGRPFLIADEARKAAPVTSAAWLTQTAEIPLVDLQLPADATLRAELAAHWTEIGLLEHASVAAFARFTLQLLSLGAPVELVEQSQRAALDEVRHAELAFALASRYAGRSIGPGALPLTGALDVCSVEAILRTTVREGCIGETRAALEAGRAAETCEDPVVRSVLETIAADEARHAELAWKVVRFIVTAHPETASILAEEFGSLDRQERALSSAGGPTASTRFGVLEANALARCHRDAYREVIAPCARTLLALAAAA